jgi:DNA-binding FadR family transcriptional regulator
MELEPGASLSSEAALAMDHGVSRLTIREALKVLEGRGLLDIGRGRRAIVREPNGSAFGAFLATVVQRDPKGLIELLEVRRALEVQSASLAAKRISRAGLAAIRAALDGMTQAAGAMAKPSERPAAEQQFHEFDVGFHEALALASGNRMLASLIEALAVPLRQSFGYSLKGRARRGGSVAETLAAHERIFALVQCGDARRAAQAMRTHLQEAERDLRAYLSRPGEVRIGNAAEPPAVRWGWFASQGRKTLPLSGTTDVTRSTSKSSKGA